MARDRVPVLKRCRSLNLDPIYLGIEKKSKKKSKDKQPLTEEEKKRLEELKAYEDTDLTPEKIMKLKERDMPKKIGINAGVPTCPVCGRRIVKCYDFCPDCGQRLEQ